MTTVVRVNRRNKNFDVYIGRAWAGLPNSKWSNPFHIGKHGSREEVITKYEQYVRSRPELMATLPELKDKVLGCWCKPEACHGDVLARLADATK